MLHSPAYPPSTLTTAQVEKPGLKGGELVSLRKDSTDAKEG